MKTFMDNDFLLSNGTARRLYQEHAATQPIFDYHCHLPPKEIAENARFATISDIWLGGDHYKWRAMRAMGHPETLITGDADPKDKFMAWAATVERLIGNPLYHWTHLELQRCFDIPEPLTSRSAAAIWEAANARLKTEALSVKGILTRFKVHAIGTTDDPIDDLAWHRALREGSAPIGPIDTKVLPSFRPDRAFKIEADDFASYIGKLEETSGVAIKTLADLKEALDRRLDFFAAAGCVVSDHGLEYAPCARLPTADLDALLDQRLSGKRPASAVSALEAEAFRTELLVHLAGSYARHGMAMQLHVAAIRNNNSRMFARIGADSGYDASHDLPEAAKLSALLDAMDRAAPLPKTILYSLNPADYYSLTTLAGCHQGGRNSADSAIPSRTQLGSAWWFLDHRDGMEEQLRILASTGALANFVGMLTDSRSFLSYPRHEYFRRILCNLVGTWVENGEFPDDRSLLGEIVEGISFKNAARYFG